MSYHTMSYHMTPYTISLHIISDMSYQIISYRIVSYHIISHHIVSYHITSHQHHHHITLRRFSRPTGTAAAQAAAIAASEIHGTGRKKGKEKVHESRWKVAADAAANASKHGEWKPYFLCTTTVKNIPLFDAHVIF